MASVILGILLVLAPLPLSAVAQIHGRLGLGSSLTAGDGNSSWQSPSGEFAFGFRIMGRGAHLLAIWFERIEEKTIVWSANGDNLAPEGSKVQLTSDGQLVLVDPKGTELWSPNPTVAGAAHAAMLDTGNFVLTSPNNVSLWGTFRQPTDTILPTQQLDLGTKVKARYSETNYSVGRFQFILQNDQNLAFYATSTGPDMSDTYWNSGTQGIGFQLIFNQSGQIYLTSKNGTILNFLSNTNLTDGFYQRATLEYDGVFRQYVHPKAANSSSGWAKGWSMVSSPIPSNICTSLALKTTGSGACGFNSYCTLGDDQIRRPQCHCPPGYTLLDLTNEMNGCRQDFAPQSCDKSKPETDQFAMREMLDTDWPFFEYELSTSQTEDSCRQACLADCLCAAAFLGDGKCRKKRIPLANGRMDPIVDGKALIKVRIDNLTTTSTENSQKKNGNSTLVISASVLLSSSMLVNVLLLILIFLIYRSFRSRGSKFSLLKP